MMINETLPPFDIGPIRYRLILPARSFANYLDVQRLIVKIVTGSLLINHWLIALLCGGAIGGLSIIFVRSVDIFLWSRTRGWSLEFSGVELVLAFCALTLLLLFLILAINWRWRLRMLRAFYDAARPTPHQFLVGDEGIAVMDDTLFTAVKWTDVTTLVRGQNQWALIIRASVGVTLPDDTLKDTPQAEEMLALIRQKISAYPV